MRNPGLKIIILLTVVVGFLVPVQAQVDTSEKNFGTADSTEIPVTDSLSGNYRDTTLAGPIAFPDSSDIRFSTDSVYSRPVQNNSLIPSELDFTAEDSIIGSPVTGEARLYNKAYVKYEDITLEAGFIRVDFNAKEVYARGITDSSGQVTQKPIFTEAGKSYRADEMRYNFDTKKAKIKKVITTEGEGFLHGEDVKKVDEKVFYIKNASFTTCSHEDPHFRIKTSKAKVISGEKVVTQLAYLEIVDVPTILFVPFGFFPTTEKRKSGIIIPSYGNSQYRGYFLQNGGYYWAVNDYLDLTLTGDIYTQGGYGWQAQTNYRKRYAYSGNLNLSYNLIRYGRPEFQEFVGSAFDNRSDFAITWAHNQDPKANPSFRFNSNVNIASSNFYRVTSVDADQVLNNRLNSSISIAKSWPGRPFNLNVSARHSQNNSTQDLTVNLPQINFALNRQFPFKRQVSVGKKRWYEEIGISYTMDAGNEIQTKLGKPFFTETVFRDSARNGVRHSIPISANYKVFKYFVFNPSVNVTHRWYFDRANYFFVDSLNAIRNDTMNGFYTNTDFNANANLSTKLYGLWRYKGFVRAVRHVFTPNVGISYKPDFAVDDWGYYQRVQSDTLGNFTRRDRYQGKLYGSASSGKSGSINLGVQNTLEAKVRDRTDSTGEKKIKLLERLSLNTSYNTAVSEFNWSPLNLTASSTAFQGLLNMNYSATYDVYGYDTELGTRVNKSAYEVNGTWLRTTNQSFTTGISLSANRFKKKGKKPDPGEEVDKKEGLIDSEPRPNDLGITEGDPDYYGAQGFVDFDAPWTLNVNYNLRKSYQGLESRVSQSMDFSGDIKLTENWKVGFRSGYDFEAKDLTYTTFDFYRDLHCWELRCTWVPFGFQQSYTLTIRVKANVLSDLKMERRRGVGDFER